MVSGARLLVIYGPQKGAIFSLTGDESRIGRESSNDIEIRDLSVSRRHCVIRRLTSGFLLASLESTNGTRVNGIPITERLLEDGDDISVGDTTLRFVMQAPEPSPVPLEQDNFSARDTARHPLESSLKADNRSARQLRALLRLAQALSPATEVDAVERLFVEAAISATGATRVAFLRYASNVSVEWSCCTAYDPAGWRSSAFSISNSVLKEVVRDRSAVFMAEVKDVPHSSPSLRGAGVRSLIVLPVIISDALYGVLYLDSAFTRFDDEHVEWLASSASIVGIALGHATRFGFLQRENLRLRAETRLRHSMVGNSAPMRDIYQRLAKIAPSDTTVLIFGESGTGKELAARAVHENSPRQSKPFIAVNCALLKDDLLESDLFGHEKGAFTGAIQLKRGKLELAEGGTLFLDELGELSLTVQAKLLRVFQERQFERLGGTRSISSNVRIVGATHRNLEEAVAAKVFRHDLYFRLRVVTLTMPPLRDRREDIPVLTEYLLQRCAERTCRRVESVEPQAMRLLTRYAWPGNIRELENVLEHALVMGEDPVLRATDLPEALFESAPGSTESDARFYTELNRAKYRIIRDALEAADWNHTQAAAILGINRTYLHRLVRSLQIAKPDSSQE